LRYCAVRGLGWLGREFNDRCGIFLFIVCVLLQKKEKKRVQKKSVEEGIEHG